MKLSSEQNHPYKRQEKFEATKKIRASLNDNSQQISGHDLTLTRQIISL